MHTFNAILQIKCVYLASVFESFAWILLNSKFIYVIGTVPSYLGNWGKKVNFSNGVAEIQQKYEREREKMEERKFWISVITLPKFLLTENQLWQCHCRNRGKKFVAIVAMPLPKMGGKKNNKIMVAEIWGGIKKKMLRPQYFYNIFTINYRWLVIISSNLNLTLRLLF